MAGGIAKLSALAKGGNISKKDAMGAVSAAMAARKKAATVQHTVKEKVSNIVGALETVAGASMMGAIDGYFGQGNKGVTVANVPLPLATGLGCHVAALLMDGETSKHLARLGDGALAYTASNKARDWAKQFRSRKAANKGLVRGDDVEGDDVEGDEVEGDNTETVSGPLELAPGNTESRGADGALLSREQLEAVADGR